MAEKDKSAVLQKELRYAILPRKTIRMFAESAGHVDITDQVLDILTEDVSYRVRELIQQSCEYMHSVKRRRLTTHDINTALRGSDSQPIYGHSSSEPVSFRQTKDEDVFFADDDELDVASLALGAPGPVQAVSRVVKASWLTIEGVEVESAPSLIGLGKSMPPTVVPPRAVSEDLLVYYDLLTKAILGSDTELMRVALLNLSTNSSVTPILPYLVNFVANGVKTVSHDTTQLVRLLRTVQALVTNPALHLDAKPYLTMIVETIVYCQLELQAASINSLNDHWVIRDISARLLAYTTRKWDNGMNRLLRTTESSLSEAILDNKRPFSSHYGAVMGLFELGLTAIEESLIPVLPQYWGHLSNGLKFESYPSPLVRPDMLVRSDAMMVNGALLLVSMYVIKAYTSLLFSTETDQLRGVVTNDRSYDISPRPPTLIIDADSTESVVTDTHASSLYPTHISLQSFNDLYTELYEHFGDSLAAILPIVRVPPEYFRQAQRASVTAKKVATVDLRDENSSNVGDDLLQQFLASNEKKDLSRRVHLRRRGGATDGDVYSERSSRSSRSEEHLSGEDADMTVKASDSGTQGIKLTILKRPKIKPPTPPPCTTSPLLATTATTLVTDLKAEGSARPPAGASGKKHSLVSVFAWVPMRNRDATFVFKFQGRIQFSMFSERQKAQIIARQIAAQHGAISRYSALCAGLPLSGKRRSGKAVAGIKVVRRQMDCALDLATML